MSLVRIVVEPLYRRLSIINGKRERFQKKLNKFLNHEIVSFIFTLEAAEFGEKLFRTQVKKTNHHGCRNEKKDTSAAQETISTRCSKEVAEN